MPAMRVCAHRIPDTIGQLDSLLYLGLSDNRLQGALPSSLGNCSNLTFLWVGSNPEISLIPDTIHKLQRLKEFSIAHTNISRLPEETLQLASLEKVYVEGAPLDAESVRLLNELRARGVTVVTVQ